MAQSVEWDKNSSYLKDCCEDYSIICEMYITYLININFSNNKIEFFLVQ